MRVQPNQQMIGTTPQLNIRYSPEFELARVENTLRKAEWYRDHGYRPTFPKGIQLDEMNPETSLDKLCGVAKTEYNEVFFQEIAEAIQQQWKWFTEHWPHEEVMKTTLEFEPIYDIQLTKYGVGGSYNLPNLVIRNVIGNETNKHTQVIFHEMLHLAIEPYIKKYEVSHWYKERFVDLLYKRLLPEVAFEQNLSQEVYLLDAIFEQHYGDVDAITKNLSLTLANDQIL